MCCCQATSVNATASELLINSSLLCYGYPSSSIPPYPCMGSDHMPHEVVPKLQSIWHMGQPSPSLHIPRRNNLATGQGMHIFPACTQVGFVWEHHTDLCVRDQGGIGEALLTCALLLSDCPTKKHASAGTLNTHPRFVLC